MKITDGVNDVAYYSYDALGRRVRVIDSIASQTRLYYYNDNWQVLEAWDDSDNRKTSHVYGNYCPHRQTTFFQTLFALKNYN